MNRSGDRTRRRSRLLVFIPFSLSLGLATTVLVAWGTSMFLEPMRGELAQGAQRIVGGPSTELPPPRSLDRMVTATHLRVTTFRNRASTTVEQLWWRGLEPDDSWGWTPTNEPRAVTADVLPQWVGDVEPPAALQRDWLALGPWRVGQRRVVRAAGFPFLALSGEIVHLLLRPPPGEGFSASPPTDQWQERVLTMRGSLRTGSTFQRSGLPRALLLEPRWWGLLGNTLFYAAFWFLILMGVERLRGPVRRRRGCCPACSYDLRGEVNSGCPECGWGRGGG